MIKSRESPGVARCDQGMQIIEIDHAIAVKLGASGYVVEASGILSSRMDVEHLCIWKGCGRIGAMR